MKVLSVCQPWAWALIHGPKRIENRTWPTIHRGPLAIHAGKSRQWLASEDPDAWPKLYGVEFPAKSDLVFGAVLGVVDVVDCVPFEDVADEPFASGPWCWIIERPRPLTAPIPWKGQLMLFKIPDRVLGGRVLK